MPTLTVVHAEGELSAVETQVLAPLRGEGIRVRVVSLEADNLGLLPHLEPEALTPGSLIILGNKVAYEVHDELVRRRASDDAISFRVVRVVTAEEQRTQRRMALPLAGGDDRAHRLFELAKVGEGPLLLEGETGTGKTQAVRSLHERLRRSGEFIVLNCAAIKENDQESVLRGVVKGAFTGVGEREGVFERCNRGTLLLDDFQDLSKAAQATLLDLIDPFSNGVTGTRLGGTKPWTADVQVIIAVNRSPTRMVRSGELRPDLLFRISKRTSLPPLRELLGESQTSLHARKHLLRQIILAMQERAFVWPDTPQDVCPALFEAFQLLPAADVGTRARGNIRWALERTFGTWAQLMPIPDEALSYTWPGNYRELDAFARAMMYFRRKVGLWPVGEFSDELDRHRRYLPIITGGTETAESVTPERHLALAWLTALTEPGASVRRIAQCFRLDPRTVKRYVAAPSERLPIEALTADERSEALAACRLLQS